MPLFGVHKTSRASLGGKSVFVSRHSVFSTLVWFWVFTAVFALKPSGTEAARKKSIKNESPKGKTSAPSAQKPPLVQPRKALLTETELPAADPLEIREHVVHRSRAGDTLPGLLNRLGLPQTENQLWARTVRRNLGAQTLPAGKEVHLYFTKTPSQGRAATTISQLKALEVDYNDAWTLTWEKSVKGIFFQKREKPWDVELKTATAVVESSIFEDGQKAGIQPTLLSQLADIFNWDVDLEKDIHKGDSLRVLFEKKSRNGQDTKTSLRVLAAELINAGQKFTAIYFEKQKGIGNYYNLEGRSLARSFLRFPLEFTSITSYFAHSRFNPILKVNMPHTGVDFAAQRGTPVRAVGDGVITQAGWNGGYGKAIDIQHDSTYSTRYGHLERFAEGIHNGVSVRKGQVIGYVGSTGRATGPHLHFEFYKDQQYVDPLSVDFPAEDTIEPGLQKVFDSQKQTFLVELTSGPAS
jgi:murein DD-endopeptidase MepM/ murein hydrolase activator NlpD